jgi:serine/threonine protein kinase/TolB-like protein/Flp pilus assembly protein TadD
MALSVAQMARMSRLLDEALGLDESGRRQWLEVLAPEDQDLEGALWRALLPDGQDGAQAPATLPRVGLSAPAPEVATLRPGDRVGPYQLVRELGSGGMAEVWLAQRADGAFKREVALKLPALARLRKDLASRFARERDILASLEHPNIARLYDAGVSAEGLPYLAMEYVAGQPLTAWCDAHRLGIRERLKLCLQVLDAVQYAHGHQVLHRDIKPSNILVTESGQVRLLDFGVAKLLEHEEHTELTQVYGRALTPEYASPELLRGERVDAATDIYALGVLLYELLAGSRPYRLQHGASLTAIEQAVMQAQVQRPSTRVAPDTAAARAMTVQKLSRRLRGDLDAIVLKTLARDSKDRYPSAEALADDLQRHLSGETVAAQPDRLSYRLSKFMLRHRTGMASGALVVMLLATLSYELIRARATTAEQQALAARGTSGLEAGAARSVAPEANDKSIAVLPFADMSERHDQEYFSDGLSEELIDRLSRSRNLRVIARTSSFQFKGKSEDVRTIANKLGVANLLEGSVRKSGQALRITAQLVRASDGSHLWSQSYDRNLSEIFKLQDEIASTVAGALEVALYASDERNRYRSNSVEAHNLLLQGDYFSGRTTSVDNERAIALFRQAVAVDPNYAIAWVRLGDAYSMRSYFGSSSEVQNMEEARSAVVRALAIDPDLPDAHQTLANFYARDWDWKAAELEIERARTLVPDSPYPRIQLAWLRVVTSARLEEAITEQRDYLSRDPLDAGAFWLLGLYLQFAGRWEASEAAFQKSLDLQPNRAGTRSFMARTYLYMGRYQEAMSAAEDEPDESWRLAVLPMVYWAVGRRKESDAALAEEERKYAAVSAYLIALAHAYRGEADGAFVWFDRAYRQHNFGMRWFKVDPMLNNVRKDPRYEMILEKMRLRD